jgi:hypothetical protein
MVVTIPCFVNKKLYFFISPRRRPKVEENQSLEDPTNERRSEGRDARFLFYWIASSISTSTSTSTSYSTTITYTVSVKCTPPGYSVGQCG